MLDWASLNMLLYAMALGVPTAWATGWLYRLWRKANAPALVAMLQRNRRRDRVIKETRERTDGLESWQTETELRLRALEDDTKAQLSAFGDRVGTMETTIHQLRKKLRSRGIVIDA